VDQTLQQFTFSRETVVKDTKNMINIIENLKIDTKFENIILWTGDVTSLYTNIPTNDALTLINELLIEFKCKKRVPIMFFLEIILNNNFFHWNDKYYHQINGTAMGSACSVVYAILFLYQLERNLVKKYKDCIYYTEDTLMIYL